MVARVSPRNAYPIGGIGFVGCHFSSGSSSLSGCSTDILTECARYLADGGTFVDKGPVDEATIVRLVVCGPILRVDLPTGHMRTLGMPWPQTEPIGDRDPETVGGLTEVSIDAYVGMWRKVGARIGVRKGETIEWSDGTTDTLPTIEEVET